MPSPVFETLGCWIQCCRFRTCSSMCLSMYWKILGRSGFLILLMSMLISVSPCGRMPVAAWAGAACFTCRPGAIDWAEAVTVTRDAAPASSAARTYLLMVFILRFSWCRQPGRAPPCRPRDPGPGSNSIQAGEVVHRHGDGLFRACHAVGLAGALDDVELVGGMGTATGPGHAACNRDVDGISREQVCRPVPAEDGSLVLQ